jgi:hypothetical protein
MKLLTDKDDYKQSALQISLHLSNGFGFLVFISRKNMQHSALSHLC